MAEPSRERSDDEWLTQLQRYDPDACRDLLQICMRASLYRLRDLPETDPELAASEAREKIINKVRNDIFTITSSFLAFARTVTHRHCLDIIRRVKRERGRLPLASMPDDIRERQTDESTGIQDPRLAAKAALLQRCFELLEATDQKILLLYFGEQLGPSSIAAEIGSSITPNNVGVRRNRALKRLKDCVGVVPN